jgi:hypothetical protein
VNVYRRIASDSSPDLSERRYSTRRAVDLDVFLITPLGDAHPANIQDVSSRGFRIRSDYGVTIGRFLTLDIPGLTRYSGWVAWSYLGEFGLEAATPVPDDIVDHIVTLGEQASAASGANCLPFTI